MLGQGYISCHVYLHGAGKMVQSLWNEIPRYFTRVETDAFVIMPNHLHAIVVLPM
jgi:REP element-mobilizing transposase RayT